MDRKKNIFDKIGSLLPGYIGYDDREGRRSSDKKLRKKITSILDNIDKLLFKKMEDLVHVKSYNKLMDIEKIRKKLSLFKSRVSYSSYGYSSFFSDNQIDSSVLDTLYMIDLELYEKTIFLKQSINSPTDEDIISIVNECIEIFDKREYIIQEFN